ncbi:Bug family tripartite tricarboxylate transporter substrate binding protein [Rhodoplanes roseus]|uniref:MFS transporter n=1 Tax=Rhodoplanes roseus TaxID=29409 RepID=A0A327KY33_9BRAD|nr:tripartite tricarboxylate transporter substrate binding protein [Rhodoplanes roseus]RAI42996.1 hypothetical protein CH341_16650 [Rhodoplanes roseus]
MTLRRFTPTPLAGLALLALLAGAAPAAAQTDAFPSRAIRLVVGFTAGGPTDVPARFLADKLSAALGVPVVVENKPGAGSMLAIRDVLSKPRDGYTLLACSYLDPVNTVLYKNPGYKLSDIAPVTLIARYDYAIGISKSLPVKTFKELVDYTKAHPNEVNYGHLGVGSFQNMVAKQLEKLTGIKMTAIPYKGAADAMQEIVAGRNHLYVGPPLVVMPLYEGGKVDIIAVTGTERLKSAPNVPTLEESGVPLVAFAWLGICAGAGTPQPVLDLLNSKIVPIVKSPEYRALVERSGSVAASSTIPEFQAVIEKSAADAAPIIEEFGLKME